MIINDSNTRQVWNWFGWKYFGIAVVDYYVPVEKGNIYSYLPYRTSLHFKL